MRETLVAPFEIRSVAFNFQLQEPSAVGVPVEVEKFKDVFGWNNVFDALYDVNDLLFGVKESFLRAFDGLGDGLKCLGYSKISSADSSPVFCVGIGKEFIVVGFCDLVQFATGILIAGFSFPSVLVGARNLCLKLEWERGF